MTHGAKRALANLRPKGGESGVNEPACAFFRASRVWEGSNGNVWQWQALGRNCPSGTHGELKRKETQTGKHRPEEGNRNAPS
jgi:hypothetical protein